MTLKMTVILVKLPSLGHCQASIFSINTGVGVRQWGTGEALRIPWGLTPSPAGTPRPVLVVSLVAT